MTEHTQNINESDFKEGEDFLLIPHPSDSQAFAIRALNPIYEGVVYNYNNLVVTEEGDVAVATFSYDVIESLDIITDKTHFEKFIARILHSIISDAVANQNYEEKEVGSITDGNSQEPHKQRSVHEDDNTVSEE